MMNGPWDGGFTMFLELSKFVEDFFVAQGIEPPRHYTREAAELVHKRAKEIAKKLLDGTYTFSE